MMKKIYTLCSMLLLFTCGMYGQQTVVRAPRPDALSFNGSTPQIVSLECAQLAQIKQCVCNLNNILQGCCSSLDMQISAVETIIDAELEDIINRLQETSNLDMYISSFEILFSLVDALNESLIEDVIVAVQGIDSSFDHISSLIDYDIAIDQTTLSKILQIDSKVETVVSLLDLLVGQNCASANEDLASNLDNANSALDVANVFAQDILAIDQTIASKTEKIDTQLDVIGSLVDVVTQGCVSRSDIIINGLQSLQEQEASCCQELSSNLEALHNDIDSRLDTIENSLEGLSNIDILTSQLELLVSIIDNVDTAIVTSLMDTTESGFDVVTSRLETLSACSSTPISSAMTITTPGIYCLDQDITGNIIIASSDVTLNLNERVVSGSVVVTGVVSNIEIINGFIDAGAANAIDIFGDIDKITLRYLYVRGLYGVLISHPSPTTHQIDINHIIAYNCQESGFLLVECYGNISNSIAYAGNDFGFAVYNSLDGESITLENCEASYNINVGFACTNQLTTALPNYNIINCTAYSNGARGFSLGKNINVYAAHCFASNNGAINTNAKDGFFIDNSLIDQVVGVIADCTSTQNANAGFNLARLNSAGPRFTGNYAADNAAANYAIASVAIAKNNPPYYWLSWKNSGAGRRVNVDGNDIS